jgi:iron(III) transport system permease protein
MSIAKVSIAKAPTAGAFSFKFRLPSGWLLAALLIAMLTLVPVVVVLSSLLTPEREIWAHLVEYQLPQLLTNTFWLVLGVGLGVAIIGVSLAWLTAVCEFPGRKQFSWALLLPLAIPAYVTAFVAIGLLDFTGPVQTLAREWWGPIEFPPIRSSGGVIAVMTLALYPYVYLIARNAFLTQGKHSLEVAQSLGLSPEVGFFRVALPMARPWIVGGVMLALMETLADFGTVAVFNYDTFTTAIYKAWFSLFSLQAASQLASLLIVFVLVVLLSEQQTRSRMHYTQTGKHSVQARILLTGARAWLAAGFCLAVLALGFIIPVTQLLLWASEVVEQDLDARYLDFFWHSLALATFAALLAGAVALLLSYSARQHPGLLLRMTARIATIGYALPGAVLAVGIFIPVAWLDNHLVAAGWVQSPLLQGSLMVMLLAYLVRFLAVAHSPIESQMHRITRSVDEAARSLGVSGVSLIARVHLPILRGGLLTAAALVFVDVMKEMPITLMTRPFGWDTLAVRVFEMTSGGEWNRAALPAVALVLVGLAPVILLTRYRSK